MAIKQPIRKRMYKTMQGRMVDIDKLRAANENVQAVGNMNVNARGDILGSGGKIIKSKESVMKDYYQTPKGVAEDIAVKRPALDPKPAPQVMNPTVKQIKQTPTKTVSKTKTQTSTEIKSGIDAALDGIE